LLPLVQIQILAVVVAVVVQILMAVVVVVFQTLIDQKERQVPID
jgi:hypothetical protein